MFEKPPTLLTAFAGREVLPLVMSHSKSQVKNERTLPLTSLPRVTADELDENILLRSLDDKLPH